MNVFDAVRTTRPFGYPAAAGNDRGRKKRKPLDEVAHLERHGEPFPPD